MFWLERLFHLKISWACLIHSPSSNFTTQPHVGRPPRPDALRLRRLEIRKELCNSSAIFRRMAQYQKIRDGAESIFFSHANLCWQTFGGNSLWPHFCFFMACESLAGFSKNLVIPNARRNWASVCRGRLPGVGPKVADCIALFALKQHGAVPVDAWKLFKFCRSLAGETVMVHHLG